MPHDLTPAAKNTSCQIPNQRTVEEFGQAAVAGKFGFYSVAKWTEFALTMATMRAAGVVFRDALTSGTSSPKCFATAFS